MSTSAQLGSKIIHEGIACDVQRIVHSNTLFQEGSELYILEETYAQLLSENGKIMFLTFSRTKHPFVNEAGVKGLDVRVWKKF